MESYLNFTKELEKNLEFSEFKKEFSYFWEKWTGIHLQLFQDLAITLNPSAYQINELKQLNETFLRKRMGIISAFIQAIKKYPHFKKAINELKKLTAEHDEKFTAILKKILNTLLTELNKLKSYRKATNAYLYSQYTLGG